MFRRFTRRLAFVKKANSAKRELYKCRDGERHSGVKSWANNKMEQTKKEMKRIKSGIYLSGLLKCVLACVVGALAFQASAALDLGGAANYAVLFEAGGGNHLPFHHGSINGKI